MQVSWVRKQENSEQMDLLTYGQETYSGDPRYTVEFQYPDNWRFRIKHVNSSDEGQYECQISTHPPKTIHVNLHINGEFYFVDIIRSILMRKNKQKIFANAQGHLTRAMIFEILNL